MKSSLVNYSSEDEQSTSSNEHVAQQQQQQYAHHQSRRPGGQMNAAKSHNGAEPPSGSVRRRPQSSPKHSAYARSDDKTSSPMSDRSVGRTNKHRDNDRKLIDWSARNQHGRYTRHDRERQIAHYASNRNRTHEFIRYEDEVRRTAHAREGRQHYDTGNRQRRRRSRSRSRSAAHDSPDYSVSRYESSSHRSDCRQRSSRAERGASKERSTSHRLRKHRRSHSKSASPNAGAKTKRRSNSRDSRGYGSRKRYDSPCKPHASNKSTNSPSRVPNGKVRHVDASESPNNQLQNAGANAGIHESRFQPESTPATLTLNAAQVKPATLGVLSKVAPIPGIAATAAVTLPAYYNPNVVKANKFVEQAQKRKLLWGSKKPEDASKKWGNAQFSQDCDGKVASKFMRLMGMKSPAATAQGETQGDIKADVNSRQRMFTSMEQQYEVARQVTHTMRGVGLGFGSQLP